MRILWLTKGLGRGGAERLLVDAAGLMDLRTHDLDIAYVLPWKNDLVAEAEAAGATVTCLGGGPRAITWPMRLRRFLKENDFDVIHTHAPLPAVVARLVERSSSARFVHTEHNLWSRYRVPTRIANALTYRRNDRVIAVSDGVAASITPRRIRPGVSPKVVLHGVPSSRVLRGSESRRGAREMLAVGDDVFLAGTVGNFTAKKDHPTLLAAFARLLDRVPTSVLVMVGSGPLTERTIALADTLGIADRVMFLGKRDDVAALLPAFDVFVLSSRFEGLPIALIEAMNAEIAVVATRVGGIPEIVTDGESGLLVEPGQPDALADALTRLADDSELRRELALRAPDAAQLCDLGSAVRTIESMYVGAGT